MQQQDGEPNIPPSELNALQALYTSTDGENWKWESNYEAFGIPWDFDTSDPNPCLDDWQGVICSACIFDAGCNVVNLDLPGHELHGSLPADLSALTFLSKFNVGFNHLTGTVPIEIASWHQLEELAFTANHLSGDVQAILVHFPKLSSVSCNTNHFSGSFPPELFVNLSQSLGFFDFLDNRLTGSLPITFGEATLLQYVDLENNLLTGPIPSSIGRLRSSLLELVIWDNYFSGSLPVELYQLNNAQRLSLTGNLFNGTLSSAISSLTSITDLNLARNAFTGTIPPEIGLLGSLGVLKVSINGFTGTLPTTLCEIPALIDLFVYRNQFTGAFPDCFASVNSTGNNGGHTSLELVDANNCYFTGSLPASLLYGGVALSEVFLNNNEFSGEFPLPPIAAPTAAPTVLPGEINSDDATDDAFVFLWLSGDSAETISTASMNNNNDSSTKSNRLWGKSNKIMRHLTTDTNSDIQFFDIDSNFITGTIPAEFLLQVPRIEQLTCSTNMLSGTLSVDALATLQQLSDFSTTGNFFSGEATSIIDAMPELIQQLELEGNFFTGFLPAAKLTRDTTPLLHTFTIANNFMTGSIPSSLWDIPLLELLNLSRNALSGKLILEDHLFINGSAFHTIDISSNRLSGSLPLEMILREMPLLRIFQAKNNQLSGSLFSSQSPASCDDQFSIECEVSPPAVANDTIADAGGVVPLKRRYLRASLFLAGMPQDSFSGVFNMSTINSTVADAINSTAANSSSVIETIDLSNNQLTGSIPGYIFSSEIHPFLSSFAAVGNCFGGKLPQTICNAEQLRTLALDGLSTASSCREVLFPGLGSLLGKDSAYILLPSRSIHGSIPPCVLNMPNLETLHLSGNALTGSLPTDKTILLSANLTDLSLSHNLLEGTIPRAIQEHPWTNLDLGFNRLTGILDPSFSSSYTSPNTSVELLVNHLSGAIPAGLLSAYSVQILQGNLFTCSLLDTKSSLPQSDSDAREYGCGSIYLDVSMYVWLACVCVVVACVVVGKYTLFRGQHNELLIPDLLSTAEAPAADRDSQSTGVASVGVGQQIVKISPALLFPTRSVFIEWMGVYSGVSAASFLGLCTDQVYAMGQAMKSVRHVCIGVTCYIMLVLLPTYTVLTTYFGTYEHQYAWIVSAVYLSGLEATLIMFVLLILLGAGCAMYILRYGRSLLALGAVDLSSTHRVSLPPSSSVKTDETNIQTAAGDIDINGIKSSEAKRGIVTRRGTESWCSRGKRISARVVLVLADVVVMVLVNGAYVYTTIHAESVVVAVVAGVLSVFKVLWNIYVLDAFVVLLNRFNREKQEGTNIRRKGGQVKRTKVDDGEGDVVADKQDIGDGKDKECQENQQGFGLGERHFYNDVGTSVGIVEHCSRDHVQLRTLLVLFNNIIAPCLAIFFVSADCFFYAVQSAPQVDVSYSYPQCSAVFYNAPVITPCTGVAKIVNEISYSPPYAYSYQCSAALLTSYAPIYVYMSLVDGLLLPLFFVGMYFTRQSIQRHFDIASDDGAAQDTRLSHEDTPERESTIFSARTSQVVLRVSDVMLPSLLRWQSSHATIHQRSLQERDRFPNAFSSRIRPIQPLQSTHHSQQQPQQPLQQQQQPQQQTQSSHHDNEQNRRTFWRSLTALSLHGQEVEIARDQAVELELSERGSAAESFRATLYSVSALPAVAAADAAAGDRGVVVSSGQIHDGEGDEDAVVVRGLGKSVARDPHVLSGSASTHHREIAGYMVTSPLFTAASTGCIEEISDEIDASNSKSLNAGFAENCVLDLGGTQQQQTQESNRLFGDDHREEDPVQCVRSTFGDAGLGGDSAIETSSTPSLHEAAAERERVTELVEMNLPDTSIPLFFHARFVSTLISNIAILTVYGAVFPPLAVAVCFQIASTTVFTQLLIGRFVLQARRACGLRAVEPLYEKDENEEVEEKGSEEGDNAEIRNNASRVSLERNRKEGVGIFSTAAPQNNTPSAVHSHSYLQDRLRQRQRTIEIARWQAGIAALNAQCAGLAESVQRALLPLFILSFSMYGFFLFDTLGYTQGALNAAWILLCMSALPLIFWFAYRAVGRMVSV